MKYQLTNKMVKYLDSSKNCPTSLELSRTAFSTRAATSLSALDSQAADTFAAINLNLLSAIYKLLLIPITLVYKINKNSFGIPFSKFSNFFNYGRKICDILLI